MSETAKPGGIAAAMKFFGKKSGGSLADFKHEWDALTDHDKEQINAGIADGSLTY